MASADVSPENKDVCGNFCPDIREEKFKFIFFSLLEFYHLLHRAPKGRALGAVECCYTNIRLSPNLTAILCLCRYRDRVVHGAR